MASRRIFLIETFDCSASSRAPKAVAPDAITAGKSNGRRPLGVGEGTCIEGAIIDKNCRIGRNVQIVNRQAVESTEEMPHGMIRDGIVVMPKGAILPDDSSF